MRLREELPFVGGEVVPVVCHSLAEVHRYAGRGNWIVKAPWSSSGKGQLRLGHPFYPKADEWMGGVLKRQGYLMLERHLDKVADFAMEFQAVGGKVEFMGWSCFETGEHGEYLGNRVAPQEVLEAELRGFLDSRWLLALKSCLPPALQEAFPGYEGYLGVDMLVWERGERCGCIPVWKSICVAIWGFLPCACRSVIWHRGRRGISLSVSIPAAGRRWRIAFRRAAGCLPFSGITAFSVVSSLWRQ